MKNKRLMSIKPSIEYKDLIIDMVDEWKSYNDAHPEEDRSPGAIFGYDCHDFDGYLAYFEKSTNNPKPEHVPSTTFFALDKERNVIVCAISVRHYLNEALLHSGGHIGDGVRPSERRKGYATEMIGLALDFCKELKIEKVMMSCHKNNVGSRKSIMKNGGVYDCDVDDGGEILERYWINLK